ncbi:hypothetical protein [Granulicella sp. dw_53]|uniref:hypothetical protein n=1 Tax=Granulicella sp. dw_53 TaxID=2719792 RepID=UPI001BD5F889|nr:hypothetical protein [Granulicella sp. dw_53]
MPTLNVRGVVINPRLKVNYHSIHPPNDIQRRHLAETLELARMMVLRTVNELQHGNRPPFDLQPIFRRILESHFHFPPITRGSTETWKHALDVILWNFGLISTGLNGPITISDAYKMFLSEEHESRLPVDANGRRLLPRGFTIAKPDHINNRFVPAPHLFDSIHVDFDLLKPPKFDKWSMANIIIHEAGHKFCGMEDLAYRNNPAYQNLTANNALFNNDSYSFTALSVYRRQCITMMVGHASV